MLRDNCSKQVFGFPFFSTTWVTAHDLDALLGHKEQITEYSRFLLSPATQLWAGRNSPAAPLKSHQSCSSLGNTTRCPWAAEPPPGTSDRHPPGGPQAGEVLQPHGSPMCSPHVAADLASAQIKGYLTDTASKQDASTESPDGHLKEIYKTGCGTMGQALQTPSWPCPAAGTLEPSVPRKTCRLQGTWLAFQLCSGKRRWDNRLSSIARQTLVTFVHLHSQNTLLSGCLASFS